MRVVINGRLVWEPGLSREEELRRTREALGLLPEAANASPQPEAERRRRHARRPVPLDGVEGMQQPELDRWEDLTSEEQAELAWLNRLG